MRKTLIYTIVFYFASLAFSFAQIPEPQWQKQSGARGCDFYTDIIEDANKGYAVTGAIKVSGRSFDFQLIRFAENGDTLWTKTIGTEKKEIPKRLTQLTDKSYVLLGTSYEGEKQSCLLVRLDENGTKLWEKTLAPQYLSVDDIISLPENRFAIAGSKSENPDDPKVLMATLNENGEITMEQLFMTNMSGCARAIKKLPNGDYALAAQISETGKNNCDIVAIRVSNAGKAKWFSWIKTPDQKVWPECICCSPDSALMIVGWNGKCLNDINSADPIFDYDLVLNKIDASGEILWTKSVDREGSEGGNALTIRPDGSFMVAGIKATSFLGKVGPWLLNIDPDGNELNEKLLNLHFNNDNASRIINSSDGGFVVIGPGLQDETNTRSDGWIIKFGAL
ncbi:hypothetical protein SAMN05444285_10933 [Draconibacterium orientale]|uniref:Uncharacterized protein n=1 Tax=Draconibacterium orientale TaxID=1168034 RepID=X5E522_9BACT|nr:hypothetical protein [Draconibacterium orientale]AHW61711.1 hypothetical protein FH5T_06930 [Draconibacterium orientale]SET26784.1 hypothetical protein SAMN05444285_10933 [Draconibacterium orientale]